MASPPSKRIRRMVAVSSDDDDSAADSQSSNANLNLTTGSLDLKLSQTSDPQRKKSSRPKPKSAAQSTYGKLKNKSSHGTSVTKNATIYSFFNNATLNGSQNAPRLESPQRESDGHGPEDAIEDISSDSSQAGARFSVIEAKKFDSKPNEATPIHSSDVHFSSVAERRQGLPPAKEASARSLDTLRDLAINSHWADLYPPESLDELAVHKRKVADIHKWLDNVLKGRERKRLLILKGPSGSGKTATLRLLAKEVGSRLVEWENPVGSSLEDEGFVSLATQFDEFLTRSINFPGLEFFSEMETTDTAGHMQDGGIILVEDFPNTFTRGSLALMNFRNSVLRYLAASTPSPGLRIPLLKITPVVMIVTETHTTSSMAQSENFTVGKLLGPQILQHPGVTIIELNPIAPTIITKAIAIVVRKQNRSRATRWSPSIDLIKVISRSGDIRSSINSLQLAQQYEHGQLQGDLDTQSNYKRTSKKRPLEITHQPTMDVAFRDNTIDLFHAVGKILYNKRKDAGPDIIDQPPSHLRHYSRPRISEVSVNAIYDDVASDVDTFILTLHENYTLSCYGEDFADNLDDCISNLSDSDLLDPNTYDNSSLRSFGKHPSSILQSEYAFQIASRSLLFALPYPVDRGKTMTSALKLGRDPFKMLYPAAMRLWRGIDDNETIIDDWIDHMQQQNDDEDESCTRLSRAEMITQLLPYATKINPNLTFPRVDKERAFDGRQMEAADPDVDGDNDSVTTSTVPLSSTLTLPLPPVSSSGIRTGFWTGTTRPDNRLALSAKTEQLVLIDDDIEDD